MLAAPVQPPYRCHLSLFLLIQLHLVRIMPAELDRRACDTNVLEVAQLAQVKQHP